mmetsp:Transcript_89366/g.288982  ORF Transcript_89366/g.288982 Transcript_89366/m.288982 type:complete len:240 (-) Transcript_89366:516-1235(-)
MFAGLRCNVEIQDKMLRQIRPGIHAAGMAVTELAASRPASDADPLAPPSLAPPSSRRRTSHAPLRMGTRRARLGNAGGGGDGGGWSDVSCLPVLFTGATPSAGVARSRNDKLPALLATCAARPGHEGSKRAAAPEKSKAANVSVQQRCRSHLDPSKSSATKCPRTRPKSRPSPKNRDRSGCCCAGCRGKSCTQTASFRNFQCTGFKFADESTTRKRSSNSSRINLAWTEQPQLASPPGK